MAATIEIENDFLGGYKKKSKQISFISTKAIKQLLLIYVCACTLFACFHLKNYLIYVKYHMRYMRHCNKTLPWFTGDAHGRCANKEIFWSLTLK